MSWCVVLGARGYLGSLLVPALVRRGHRVTAVTRTPDARLSALYGADVVLADATDEIAVRDAVTGADVVYYLVHSMGVANFAELDRTAAAVVARAAGEANVRQLVYVGGPRPNDGRAVSAHLASRAEVGDILGRGPVPALRLQASMIIGAGSASFELLRRFTVHSPLVPFPSWMNRRSAPVAVSDVLHYLVAAAECAHPVDGVFDLAGPEELSYFRLVQRCARVAGLRTRLPVPAPFWSHELAGRVAGVCTPVPAAVATVLFCSLDHDLAASARPIADVLPPPADGPLSVDKAIRRATTAIGPRRTGESDRSYVDERVLSCAASADDVWRVIIGLGGKQGWHTIPLVWAARGALDHFLGGVGLYRGRAAELEPGDVVDFWTVLARDDDQRHLVLRADLRMPGETVLELTAIPEGGRSRYRQRMVFTPDGVAGRVYWRLQKPLHDLVFAVMGRGITSSAARAGTSARIPRREGVVSELRPAGTARPRPPRPAD
ncbi:Uncharacterized conserved protein YbjT, contains NAD(P)-binding and DUF2867 domains [Amycolatopsis marina]|uniref:Uncharacterized conserved protein YbjT, contains NAD(P)-binding and DUF2867 domains n=1 Tax=Amycolatopsis marina TaxID=490629 RepID=A0A1I0Z2G2_9PSEU|nr:DUF2867 domain-containing protein [Amycolatopsis marina]SFB19814.1 Uncharacterized conserved protein YbjT, contains NAD(P)-binding and DUF2867 domains [Amycolatopsis marina]